MARTFQTEGNPVVARLELPGTASDKRQLVPYGAICDYAGREAMVAGFGDLVTGERHVDVSAIFNYGINPETTVTEVTGTGVVDTNLSRLRLSVTGGAGTAFAYSKKYVVYRMGHDAVGLFTCAFDTPNTGITQKAGMFDDDDGFFVSLDESGNLQANHRVGGVTTTVSQADFNLDNLDGSGLSDHTIDPQALTIYRISYGYLGIYPAVFEVYAGFILGWVPFHVFDFTNTQNTTQVRSPSSRIRFEVESDGTNDVTVYSGSWMAASIGDGRSRSLNDQFSFSVSKTIAAGVEDVIGSMRVKSTFGGFTNKIPVDFHSLTGGLDGTKSHVVRVYKNTPLTSPVWQNLIGDNSAVEIDLSGSLLGPSADEIRFTDAAGKVSKIDHVFETGEIRLVAGDTLTFTVQSANASDIVLAGQWDELK